MNVDKPNVGSCMLPAKVKVHEVDKIAHRSPTFVLFTVASGSTQAHANF